MKKRFVMLLVLLFVFGLLKTLPASAALSPDDCNYSKGKITSISPIAAVRIGDSVTINGQGFGELKKVMIGSWPTWGYFIYNKYVDITLLKDGRRFNIGELDNSEIISWTDTKIQFSIPAGFEGASHLGWSVNEYEAINLAADTFIVSVYFANLVENGVHDGIQYYTHTGAGSGYICAEPYSNASFLYSPTCTADTWTCADWSACSSGGQQSRSCNKTFNCPFVDTPSPLTTQSCIYTPPTCTSWTYSNWNTCTASGQQIRNIISSIPNGCTGGGPVLSQSCTPVCTTADWSCADWSLCATNGQQARTCTKKLNCQGGVTVPNTIQSCAYIPTCTSSDWLCGSWSGCSSNGTMTRDCKKASNCEGGPSSPSTNQSCSPTSPCEADTWTCSVWSSCSPSGIQNRNCTKTSDCPNVQTGAPATEQFCEVSNKPQQVVFNEPKEKVVQGTVIEAIIKSFTSNNDTDSNPIISTTSQIKKTTLQSQDDQTQKESIIIVESSNNSEVVIEQNTPSTTSEEETNKPSPVRRFFLWIFLKIKFW